MCVQTSTIYFQVRTQTSMLIFTCRHLIFTCRHLLFSFRHLLFTLQVRRNFVSRLSLLFLPRSFEERPLVSPGHVTTCETNFSTRVASTNHFCRSQLKRKMAKLTTHGQIHLNFEILQSCFTLHKAQTKYIYVYPPH